MSFIDNIFGMIDGVIDTLSMPLKFISGNEPTQDDTREERNSDGSITINGIVVPKLVAEQLKNAGIPIAFLNAGQLEAAIQACAIDCRLIDDPNGTDFFDDLALDEADYEEELERQEGEVAEEDELNRRNFMKAGRGSVFNELSEVSGSVYATQSSTSFRQRIKDEREEQRERRKHNFLKELLKEDDSSAKSEILTAK